MDIHRKLKWIAQKELLSGILCLCFFAGCATVEEKPSDKPFHTLYRSIKDPEATRFLEAGIAYLEAHHGPLEYPIHEVELRFSFKNETGRSYRLAEGFSKTEIVDGPRGHFAIYLAVPPSDPEFYPLLAHEIGHLKKPSLVDDWAMEGFCMVFSEALCQHLGYDWSIWRKRFSPDSGDPYAKAYWSAKNATE